MVTQLISLKSLGHLDSFFPLYCCTTVRRKFSLQPIPPVTNGCRIMNQFDRGEGNEYPIDAT